MLNAPINQCMVNEILFPCLLHEKLGSMFTQVTTDMYIYFALINILILFNIQF